ncbi:hypothetical protein FHP26_02080 [Pseudomonas orientalis]|nr:hypothetical protein [Pseudomonas orientalis]
MTECQLINLWLAHCHRGQAPSHIKVSVFDRLRVASDFSCKILGRALTSQALLSKCGRGLAPDSGVSARNLLADPLLSG